MVIFHIATDKILAEKQEEIEKLTRHKCGMLQYYNIGMTKHKCTALNAQIIEELPLIKGH